jgi:RNA polymerase sigma factor (TIGR02999 family)
LSQSDRISPIVSYRDIQSQDRNDGRSMTSIGASGDRFVVEPEALTDLMPSVYEELRRLAADYLRGERPGHTLQPTALVHEAYLRLLRQGQTTWQNRAHVLGFGARIMRQILISHAIASTRLKRGGPHSIRITLDEALDFYDRREMSVSAVDEALRSLEEIDPRQGQIVEMRFFGGLTIEEIAKALDVSSTTVKREWTFAKVWLRRELSR